MQHSTRSSTGVLPPVPTSQEGKVSNLNTANNNQCPPEQSEAQRHLAQGPADNNPDIVKKQTNNNNNNNNNNVVKQETAGKTGAKKTVIQVRRY